MRILVTGGNGFLGSHLVDRLIDDGHLVLSMDRTDPTGPGAPAAHANLTRVTAEIEDEASIDAAFTEFEPDAVAHLAAAYRDPNAWSHHVLANVIGTTSVLRAAKDAGVSRFVFFQTGLTYGNAPAELPVPLSHPQEADTSYAITKIAAERYVEISGLDYVTLRLPTVYGPRMAGGPLVIFYKCLSEGLPFRIVDARRDFIYVDDVMDLVTMVLGGTGHGAYNVGSGGDRAIKDLFDIVRGEMGVEPKGGAEVEPLPDGEPRTLLLDPARMSSDFAWAPSTPLEEGVPRAIRWYRENGVIDAPFTHLGGRGDDPQTRASSLSA